jgi:hypothetical protein
MRRANRIVDFQQMGYKEYDGIAMIKGRKAMMSLTIHFVDIDMRLF